MKNIFISLVLLLVFSSSSHSQELNISIDDRDSILKYENHLTNKIIENQDYKILIVKPDPNIDYKILQVRPDKNIDFKLQIYDPGNNKQMQVPENLEKILRDYILKNEKISH
ncbi:MAG: hypothetical protein H8E61_03630 [Bacteroidetes bacterium]|nr:hypothetical protein [Bacteroidota bacterium]